MKNYEILYYIGALSPIQSQGICGSCWTFSTTAAVESAHFIKVSDNFCHMYIKNLYYNPKERG